MDKDTLVSEQTESGERLISAALAADGFDIRVAFWLKPTDKEGEVVVVPGVPDGGREKVRGTPTASFTASYERCRTSGLIRSASG